MIPEKVKIGCFEYSTTIHYEEKPLAQTNLVGEIDYLKQTIDLAGNYKQGEQGIEASWWHEVVHGLMYDRELHELRTNEDVTERLAKALYALMKDNSFPLPGQKKE